MSVAAGRADRARAALRRRPVYYGVSAVLLVVAAAIVTLANAPEWVVVAVVVAVWACLMYLLRWRSR